MRRILRSVLVVSAVGLVLLAGTFPALAQTVYNYTCDGGKGFQATYGTDSAMLEMGGTTYQLQQQVAASGTRYSNDTVTLYTKGDTAFIQENGVTTYNNCTTSQSMPAALPTTGSSGPQGYLYLLAAAAVLMIGLGAFRARRAALEQ